MAAKILQDGLKVQTAAGAGAFKVDGTTGAAEVGPSSGTDDVFHQTIGYQANSWIQGFLNRASATGGGIYCGGTDGKWSGYGHADGHIFGAWNGSSFLTVGSCTQAGAWALGASSLTSTSTAHHTTYGRVNHYSNETTGTMHAWYSDSGGSNTVQFYLEDNGKIYTRNANWGTGGTAIGISSGFLTTSPSAARYKTNISELSIDSSKIFEIKIKEFDYIESKGGAHDFGPIADEVEAILPALVWKEDGQPESIRETKMVWLLLEEMKKQQAMIEELKAEVALLKAK